MNTAETRSEWPSMEDFKAENARLRAEVENLKDKYDTCEQCDGSTDAGVLCLACWNRVNLQVERYRKTLEEIGRMRIYENAEAYLHQLISDTLADKRTQEPPKAATTEGYCTCREAPICCQIHHPGAM